MARRHYLRIISTIALNVIPKTVDPADAPDLPVPAAPPVAERRQSSLALNGLFTLAVLATLYFVRDLVLPIALALMLSVVLTPVMRTLNRLRLPPPLSAAIVLFTVFAALSTAAYNLGEPANQWLTKAPEVMRVIGLKLRDITGRVMVVAKATEQVKVVTEDMANGGTRERRIAEVTVKERPFANGILVASQAFFLSAVSTVVLLFFMLASGDLFMRKVIAVTPRFSDKKRAVDIMRQIEAEVSTYLFTVSTINIGLGCTVALALYLLDVPNPVLWGVMVALFNFVPYFGDLASFTVLSVVGLLTFDDLWQSLLVPGAFCVLTATEGYLITPLILGRRLSLNPVVIVLSVVLWSWMWGLVGALLAVPMLVVAKTYCSRIDSLRSFSEFLEN